MMTMIQMITKIEISLNMNIIVVIIIPKGYVIVKPKMNLVNYRDKSKK